MMSTMDNEHDRNFAKEDKHEGTGVRGRKSQQGTEEKRVRVNK